MKKIVVFIVLAIVLSFVACGKSSEFKGVKEGLRYSETYQIVSVAKEGVIYKGKDSMLHFRPSETGEDVILCYDPNCIHEPASDKNTDPTCRAALFNNRTQVAYYEGNIYYFVQESIYSHKLYKMEINGAGRTLIKEIPFSFDTLYGVIFYEDKMYYIVMETIDIKDTLDKNFYLLEFDLKSGEYRTVTPIIEDTILDMQITENYAYIRLADVSEGGKIYVARYDIKTGKEEVVVSAEEYQICRFLRAYDEHYVYADYSEGASEIGLTDIASNKKTVLIEIDNSYKLGSVWASGNGIFYNLIDFLEDGTPVVKGYFFYDMLTGEKTEITEKALEHNIMKYDGYNKIFICGTLYNTSVISEELVLGTKGDVSE